MALLRVNMIDRNKLVRNVYHLGFIKQITRLSSIESQPKKVVVVVAVVFVVIIIVGQKI